MTHVVNEFTVGNFAAWLVERILVVIEGELTVTMRHRQRVFLATLELPVVVVLAILHF